MKIIFFGSSDFSLPPLQACLDAGHEIVEVVTTPDQKKGRGMKVLANPVKLFCEGKGIPCTDPETLKTEQTLESIRAFQPHLFVVASYGKMIPTAWLAVPSVLAINVHPSLLPKYRGAAPLHWPILHGEKETGLSLAEVTAKLDAGDIFYQKAIRIAADANSEKLSVQLSQLAYSALLEILRRLSVGETLARQPQDETRSSYARKLEKEDGFIALSESAEAISRKVRGLRPWPGASFLFQGEPLTLLDAAAEPGPSNQLPGTFLQWSKDGSCLVQTGEGAVRIRKVKPAGRGAMNAADFIRGRRLEPGFNFIEAHEKK